MPQRPLSIVFSPFSNFKLMKIKACIFDLDGVIVDTAKYHYLAWKVLADQLGFVFTESHNERLKGVSRMDSLEILLAIGGVTHLTEQEKLTYAAEKNTLYLSFIEQMDADEILPNVRPFLQDLRNNNVKISLGSASKNAVMILEKLNLMPLFDAIVDGRHITNAKPDPEVFLKGAKALGVASENCVVFEDAVAGVQAAKSAGMACVGIGEPSVLSQADHVIPGFNRFSFETLNTVLR